MGGILPSSSTPSNPVHDRWEWDLSEPLWLAAFSHNEDTQNVVCLQEEDEEGDRGAADAALG